MKLVVFSVILNAHQSNVCDVWWELTGGEFRFVELANLSASERKGDVRDYNDCPYLLRAWESDEARTEAMELARTAECSIFSTVLSLPYMKERMKLGLLSFDMSERWLKRGLANALSPAIRKMLLAYHLGRWSKKPLYKLCCSAFAAQDQYVLKTFKDKCYKWGYFTRVENFEKEDVQDVLSHKVHSLMWCARYLDWKHPELPILMAERLKRKGYRFVLDMYGSGEYEESAKKLVLELGVDDVVNFCGNKPNDELMRDMQQHEIFLFTSDRNEGWGAVANESMANGCALVVSDAIGSVPYLIEDGVTGLIFKSAKTSSSFGNPDMEALDSLCDHVGQLLDNIELRHTIQHNATKLMQEVWSPRVAAARLLMLIDNLRNGADSPFVDGPCSRA